MSETVPAGRTQTRLDPAAIARFRDDTTAEYVRRHPTSRALHEQAQGPLPGGDTRTVTFFDPFPLYMNRGSGCRLYDVDGHSLLDLLGNYTSMIWGHAHPKIVEAIRAQAARGTGFAAPTESQAVLGAMIRERLPSMDKIRFTNSGTEAAMHAIRAARAFTGRDAIVKMEGGYHGSSDAVEISVHPDPAQAGPAARPRPIPDGRGIPAATLGDVLIAPFNDAAACEAILRTHHARIAAVIVEPVQGVAGTIAPRDGFLTALREITRELGIVLIFDEVIAFRVGYHGAQGLYRVTPDLTVQDHWRRAAGGRVRRAWRHHAVVRPGPAGCAGAVGYVQRQSGDDGRRDRRPPAPHRGGDRTDQPSRRVPAHGPAGPL
jgi:glutamate-1-semialdehyde 2,1-aminomutase